MHTKILYTQPELAASMVGGIVSLNTILLGAHDQDHLTRSILYFVYAVGLVLFIGLGVWLARKRLVLEVEGTELRSRNKTWQTNELKEIVWTRNARRFLVKPNTGFGLSLTLPKESAEEDAKLILEWAKVNGIPIRQK